MTINWHSLRCCRRQDDVNLLSKSADLFIKNIACWCLSKISNALNVLVS